MAYSLRLPPRLEAATRTHADYLGISINALVCVALDTYMRGTSGGALVVAEIPPPEAFELVGEVPSDPDTGGKKTSKKISFKDRQRSQDELVKKLKASRR